jgi:hypothetical protein
MNALLAEMHVVMAVIAKMLMDNLIVYVNQGLETMK